MSSFGGFAFGSSANAPSSTSSVFNTPFSSTPPAATPPVSSLFSPQFSSTPPASQSPFSSHFNNTPAQQAPSPPPGAPAQGNSWGQQPAAPAPQDKGLLLACLNESKAVQIAIFNELKTLTARFHAQPSTSTVHKGVFCNVCGKNDFTGVRYKCFFCKDFDMCGDCEATQHVSHDPSHVFLTIKDTDTFNNKIAMKAPTFLS